MPSPLARHGWQSDFPSFRDASPRVVRGRLHDFIRDASDSQIRAWDDSIPKLQHEVGELLVAEPSAAEYTAILEYELPLDARRPDVILLVRGAVVVLELKGKRVPSQADLDQAAAYARDLRGYHRACADRPVHAVVVPTGAKGYVGARDGIHVAGPDALDQLLQKLENAPGTRPMRPDEFLAEDAYRPLPTLVQAARELFRAGTVRPIHRARAATEPALAEITRVIHEAARSRTRRLVLLTGVPGAGKTLVGLQAVHAHFLDDLAVDRGDGKPSAPAVFLSGNGPLVEVLQYELRGAGGGGQTFVRDVKSYVRRYSGKRALVPPEHVLVFDEAQRAWDADKVAEGHGDPHARSEPEHFVEFAERIPEWCVVIGLIGSGQEIHLGEEGGLALWRRAVEGCANPDAWTVHGPRAALEAFAGSPTHRVESPALNLDREIRQHLATDLHLYVQSLLSHEVPAANRERAARLQRDGYHLRITRDLDEAKSYLRERYAEHPTARFGLIASSKDKELARFGIPNEFQDTKRMKLGPWFGDDERSALSCRHLDACATEFQAQGLELDAALLAWGTDLLRQGGQWTNRFARGYKRGAKVRDPFQLRLNSYRVLLTRGRDATVVFVPPMGVLDETYELLVAQGFLQL
jgi:hypothetical protein